ncbi:hypothetical protein BOX15_Mlig000581g4 [Macrostomum lignano]|uniref:Major facilitator superfamily (MFS) profile domain-containing protein n=1 Tax=Macrostomum lignano TaxID=282301 RepID=A0A267FPP2_9PLAT|nr:hypothetical protein BOX15_Mlig000581g4 [Macrostomum lignano]
MPSSFESLEAKAPLLLSYRARTAAVVFLGTLILYSLRVNMSIALVCMVKPLNESADGLLLGNATDSRQHCGGGSVGDAAALNSTDWESGGVTGEFDWDRTVQGQILSSFFFGYLFLQIPAGLLAQLLGPKLVIAAMIGLASVSTLLLPAAARIDWRLVVALRILTGLGSGVMFPGLHQLWSGWAPPMERSKLVGFSYAGAQIGTIITLPLSSLLCRSVGWDSIFYVFGGLGCVWVAVWLGLVHNSPEQHPWISKAEKRYIQRSLQGQVSASGEHSARLPVLSVAASLPFWAIIVSNVAYDYGGYTFLTNLPTYFKDVFGFTLMANGLLSALPYIGFFVFQFVAAWLADLLQARAVLSTRNTRKLMSVLSMGGPGSIIISLGFIGCDAYALGIAMLVIGITFKGAAFSGFLINHVDIAPRYAGVLFGVSNTVAALTGLIAPNVVAAVVRSGSQSEWLRVFLITSTVYWFGSLFYAAFGQGELQPWAAVADKPAGDKQTEKKAIGEDGVALALLPPVSAGNGPANAV